MKVMVSQPMSGIPDEEIKKTQQKIKEDFAKMHIEVINTIFDYTSTAQHPGLDYMSKSIEAMCNVDAVFFHKDWRSSRGCRIERELCRVYNVKILDWDFLYKDDFKNRFYADGKVYAEKDKDGKVTEIPQDIEKHIPRLD